ncbi:hypothetical protein HK096_007850 [Nowakowskiella sp. JEL0078]|nr:hypothetical protein HK096_007850 [Nowakowskiella sp. JEL0078]
MLMNPLRLGVLISALVGAVIPVFHVLFLYFSFDALQNRLSVLTNLPSPIPCLHSDTYARVVHIERLSKYYSWTVVNQAGAVVPNNQTLIVENFRSNGIPSPTNGITVAFCVIAFGWYLFMAFLVPTVNPIGPGNGSKVDLTDSDTLESDSIKKPKFRLNILKGLGLLTTIAAIHTVFTLGNGIVGVLAYVSTRDGFFTLETPTIIDDPTAKNLDVAFLVQEGVYLLIGLIFSILMWNYIFLARRRPSAILKFKKGKQKDSQPIDSVSEKPDVVTNTGSQAAIITDPYSIAEQLQIRHEPRLSLSRPSSSIEPSKVSVEITDNEYSKMLALNLATNGYKNNPNSMTFGTPQQAYASSLYNQTPVQHYQALPQQNFQSQIISPVISPMQYQSISGPKRISDLPVEVLEKETVSNFSNVGPTGRIQISTSQLPKAIAQKSSGTTSPDIDEVFAITAETDYPYVPFSISASEVDELDVSNPEELVIS